MRLPNSGRKQPAVEPSGPAAGRNGTPVSGMRFYSGQRARAGKHIGKVLDGRFHIVERIGEGAEGITYLTEIRDRPGEVFAVKVSYTPLPQTTAADGLPGDPILREHEVLRHLRAPWFPRVVAAGRSRAGYSYVVRQHVDGVIAARLSRRPGAVPLTLCLAIGVELCRAVEHLHDAGFIHRDIKPGNILVVPSPDDGPLVRLIDFGSACPVDRELVGAELGEIPPGTAAYMPPERVRGEPGGKAADLYAVGCVLYELFTGHPPLGAHAHHSEGAREYLLSGAPIPVRPLDALRPEVPRFVARAIHRALLRDGARRGSWVAGLRKNLELALGQQVVDLDWIEQPWLGEGEATAEPPLSAPRRWFERVRARVQDLIER